MKTSRIVMASGFGFLALAISSGFLWYRSSLGALAEVTQPRPQDLAVDVAYSQRWAAIGVGAATIGLVIIILGYILGIREK